MSHIFLSYANEDRDLARRIVGLLETANWPVWWDRRIPAGMNWNDVLDKALADMRCMIVLWTRHSVESTWVYEEAEEGRSRGLLLPVLMEAVQPPRGFRSIQAADLSAWEGDVNAPAAQQLLQDLKTLAGPAEAASDGGSAMGEKPQPLAASPAPAPSSAVTARSAPGVASNRAAKKQWLPWLGLATGALAAVGFLVALLNEKPGQQPSTQPAAVLGKVPASTRRATENVISPDAVPPSSPPAGEQLPRARSEPERGFAGIGTPPTVGSENTAITADQDSGRHGARSHSSVSTTVAAVDNGRMRSNVKPAASRQLPRLKADCRALLERASVGEPLSNAERALQNKECKQ